MMEHAPPPPRWSWIVPAVLAAALYALTLEGPFLYDDQVCVVDNEQIRNPANFAELWTSSFPPGRAMSGLYRPATAATFLLDHWRAGLSAAAFHATNVLLHAIAAGLVAKLLLTLGRRAREACVAGTLFALHAVHVEAVAWVVGRAEILAAIFVLWSSIAWFDWVRNRRTSALLTAALAYFLGLASKEVAGTLPVFLLAATVLLQRSGAFAEPATSKRSAPAPRPVPLLRAMVPFAVAAAVYLVLRKEALGTLTPVAGSLAFDGLALDDRLATAFWCLLRGALLLLVPWPLQVDYARELVDGFASVRGAAGLVFMVVLVAATVHAWRCRAWAGIWIAWTLVFVFVVSNVVVPIGAVMAERFLYVPSIGACALLALLFERGWNSARAPLRTLATAVLLFACAGHAAVALHRIGDWNDEERFWRTFLAQDPRSEKAHQALGDLQWKRSQAGDTASTEPSLQFLRDGAKLAADDPLHTTRDHVEIVLRLADRLRVLGRAEESIPWFEEGLRALERDTNLASFAIADMRVLHALALEAAGKPEEARAAYELASRKSPTPGIFVNLGLMEERLGRFDEALASLKKAKELDPRFVLARVNLGVLLLDRGRTDEALAEFDGARKLDPGAWIPQLLARWLLEKANKPHAPEAALQWLSVSERVSRAAGDGSVFALARGMLAERAGDRARALREYEAALVFDPTLAPAREGRTRVASGK